MHDDAIAPHPARKPPEVVERLDRAIIAPQGTHPAIGAIDVRPVALDGDDVEAARRNQRARDVRANVIELVRAVRGFAQQHMVRVADQRQQRVVVARAALQRPSAAAQRIGGRRAFHAAASAIAVPVRAAASRLPAMSMQPQDWQGDPC